MNCIKILVPLLFLAGPIWGADLGYTRSESASSMSDKFKISYSFDRQNRLGLSYKSSKDKTGSVDDKSSSLKLNYRYRFESSHTMSFDYKKTDESYFYEGQAYALKSKINIIPGTKLSLSLEGGEKAYTKSANENIFQLGYSVGVDQDILTNYTVGIEYSGSSFSSNNSQSKSALKNQVISNANISSYVSYLTANSISCYLEYNVDLFTLGGSYSLDSYLLSGSKVVSTEVYGDLNLSPDWTVSVSYTQGVSEGSTTATQTVAVGLSYYY
jgi:hypothetical protein